MAVEKISNTVPYSIQNEQVNSNTYYSEIRGFCEEVLEKAEYSITPIVGEFIKYLRSYNLEDIRETEEYILELLSFGVLWHAYSQKALSIKIAPFVTLSKMAEWRKKHQRLKPFIDLARGFLITLFLVREKSKLDFVVIPTLEQIDHVCKWFEATGEFREQALRFIRWRAFWGTKAEEDLIKTFTGIYDFTIWFGKRAEEKLGGYTENVEPFLKNSRRRYKWHEDRIQCTRTRSEYHLNMVGAELMNRAFRDEFQSTGYKVVLVPGCMRAKPQNECEAVRLKEGLMCKGCTSSCNVNRLRAMGEKHNFAVYIIPHASDLSLWSPRKRRVSCGVIASACVTTLVEGGWELKRYDIPAQCVLLDYCGCQKHWHSTGIPTKFNMSEFRRILDN